MQDASDHNGRVIRLISPPEAVRVRPKMYIDSTDHRGLHMLLRLTVESLLSHYTILSQPLNKVIIRFEDDGSATITCQGPTPSVTFLQQSVQVLEWELQAQTLHTSLLIVNALCEHLRMGIRGSDGSFHSFLFKQGVIAHDEALTSLPREGGAIWFRLYPDLTILETGVFDSQLTLEMMKSFLDSNPSTFITVIDDRPHTA